MTNLIMGVRRRIDGCADFEILAKVRQNAWRGNGMTLALFMPPAVLQNRGR
jgi:hypothetical protein